MLNPDELRILEMAQLDERLQIMTLTIAAAILFPHTRNDAEEEQVIGVADTLMAEATKAVKE